MSGGYSAARARQDEYLASLVIRDARARADGVDKDGVLAYLHRPKTRERPNETFLANTLRGVRSANERGARRANDTERCVASGRGARRRDDRADASGEASPSSSSTTTSSSPSALSRDGDAELAAFLSRPGRARRGRGATGSRADEPGPHLPPPSSSTLVRADGYAYVAEDPAETVLADAPREARTAKRAKRDARKERKEKKRKEERKERKRAKRPRRARE